MTDRLFELCRELRNVAETSGEGSEDTRQAIRNIIAELDLIDETKRISDVAWRKQQERFALLSKAVQ